MTRSLASSASPWRPACRRPWLAHAPISLSSPRRTLQFDVAAHACCPRYPVAAAGFALSSPSAWRCFGLSSLSAWRCFGLSSPSAWRPVAAAASHSPPTTSRQQQQQLSLLRSMAQQQQLSLLRSMLHWYLQQLSLICHRCLTLEHHHCPCCWPCLVFRPSWLYLSMCRGVKACSQLDTKPRQHQPAEDVKARQLLQLPGRRTEPRLHCLDAEPRLHCLHCQGCR